MVITGLTRNQLGRKVSWVRIPPAPPDKNRAVKPSVRLGSAVLFCIVVIDIRFFYICIFFINIIEIKKTAHGEDVSFCIGPPFDMPVWRFVI